MQDELEYRTENRTCRTVIFSCLLFSLARGFHEYRKMWAQRSTMQTLSVKQEKGNLYDPYAIGLYTKIRGKITTMSLVGHLPREISRFCKFYIEYGGNITAIVRDSKFRRQEISFTPRRSGDSCYIDGCTR